MKLHSVIVQIQKPTSHFPDGQVAEGRYTFEDGELTLTDHVGQPVRDQDGNTYSQKLLEGEDAQLIAGRLTKKFRQALRGNKKHVAGFTGRIRYPNIGII